MYLHGSTAIGGHFTAIEPQHLVDLPQYSYDFNLLHSSVISEIMNPFHWYFCLILLFE